MDKKIHTTSAVEGEQYLSMTDVDGQLVYERSDALRWTAERDVIEARYTYTIRCLKRKGAKRVLDVGCGLGYGTWLLDRAGFEVTGIDLSEEALKTARARYPWIHFEHGDLGTLQIAPVDGVVACEVIEHVPEPKPFLSAIYRLLKPGGILVVSTPHAKYTVDHSNIFHEHEYSLAELKRALGTGDIRSLDTRLLKPARLWIALLGEERFMRVKYRLSRLFPFHQLPEYSRTLMACATKEQLETALKSLPD